MNELSWPWIALMLTGPPLAGLIVALPLWHRKEMILGNATGTRDLRRGDWLDRARVDRLDRITQGCLDAGFVCWPEPSAFVRYAIDAVIGLLEVFGLFTFSLSVEKRIRNRGYAPEWR